MITQPSNARHKSFVKKYCGNAEKKFGPCLKINNGRALLLIKVKRSFAILGKPWAVGWKRRER
jgi:hypothetical protein